MKKIANFIENLEKAMQPVLSRVNENYWEKSRTLTIGAAGLSAAILFLLAQINISTVSLKISFFCATLAIPTWLALWQVGEAYSFHGERSYKHFAKIEGFGVGVTLFLLGSIFLLLSFSALIWHFSIFTALVFMLASSMMVRFVNRHHNSVRQWAEEGEDDNT